MEEKVDLLYFGVAPWDVPATPSASESVGEYPGSLSNSQSRPARLCVGTVVTLEVYASELRFVGRSRRRDMMVDKSQSYLSFVQGAVILYMSGNPVNTVR